MTKASVYGHLSVESYVDGGGTPPAGWVQIRTSAPNDTGYYGVLYKNTTTGEFVLANRGTEFTSADDLIADFKLGIGVLPAQYESAKAFYNEVTEEYGNSINLSLTGHSLGGALASMLSVITGFKATVLDSPGMRHLLSDMERIEGVPAGTYTNASYSGQVMNHNAIMDAVSDVSDQIGDRIDHQLNVSIVDTLLSIGVGLFATPLASALTFLVLNKISQHGSAELTEAIEVSEGVHNTDTNDYTSIINQFQHAFTSIINIPDKIATSTIEAVRDVGDLLVETASGLVGSVKDIVLDIGNKIGNFFGNEPTIPTDLNSIDNSYLDFKSLISSNSNNAADTSNSWQTGSAIGNGDYSANMPVDVINGDGFTNTEISKIVTDNYRPGAAELVLNTISNGINSAVNFISNAVSNVANTITSSMQSAFASITNFFFSAPNIQNVDPLVVDLNGDGVKLINFKDSHVSFDVDHDGYKENTGWVSREDGIVVHDKNRDGIINDISETISEYYTSGVTDGLEALKTLDSNKDNIFDKRDSMWGELKVWRDANSDGNTDSGELLTFEEAGILSINLNREIIDREHLEGNPVLSRSTMVMADGSIREAAAVDFATNPLGYEWNNVFDGAEVRTENNEASSFIITSAEGRAVSTTDKNVNNIYGGVGNDTLIGDNNNNWLIGGAGADKFNAGGGDDLLIIDADDRPEDIDAGEGFDNIRVIDSRGVILNLNDIRAEVAQGGDGDDTLISGALYNTFISGGAGNDIIIGGAADDALSGEDGDDLVDGGYGDDVIRGHRGADMLIGGLGDDYIDGGLDNDTLKGGEGNDILIGGAGNDNLQGGVGFDMAQYDKEYDNYIVTKTTNGFTVKDLSDGSIDTLQDVEKIRFSNVDFGLESANSRPLPIRDDIVVNSDNAFIITPAQLLANDWNLSGGNIFIRNVSDAVGGTVELLANGNIRFTPEKNFLGEMSFDYTVKDADGNYVSVYLKGDENNAVALRAQVNIRHNTDPVDPLFYSQWYLSEIRVKKVWQEYSGKDIEIGIFEGEENSPFNYNHSDLNGNISAEYIEKVKNIEVSNYNNHSTLVAGVISAEKNNEGSIGIAYDAQISQNSWNPGNDGLNGMMNYDIANNSWAFTNPFDDNFISSNEVRAISAKLALNNAVNYGRSGLGTAIVQGAGNSRKEGDNVNYHNLINSRFNITTGSINQEGDLSKLVEASDPFSNPGAAILVSAPGSNIKSTGNLLQNENGSTFGSDFELAQGTSFSAPIISGVVALMLEANPNLGYRDIQKILAYSARKINDDNTAWKFNGASTWNGGGLHYSNDYGFGIVDAHTAVRLAETWDTINAYNNEISASAVSNSLQNIADNGSISSSVNISSDTKLNVEYAEVTVDIAHGRIGDLVITLNSPDGTTSILLDRPGKAPGSDSDLGIDNIDTLKFTLSSANFYGEHASGKWQLRVEDKATGETGVLKSWKLDLYGSPDNANDTYIFTDELGINDQGQHTISDLSGVDTINASGLLTDSVINLNIGAVSTINGKKVNLAINEISTEFYKKQAELSPKQQQVTQLQAQVTQVQDELANKTVLLPVKIGEYNQAILVKPTVTIDQLNAQYAIYNSLFSQWREYTAKFYDPRGQGSYVYTQTATNKTVFFSKAQHKAHEALGIQADNAKTLYNSMVDQYNSEATIINSIVTQIRSLQQDIETLPKQISQLQEQVTLLQNEITSIQNYLNSFGNGNTIIENAYGGDGNDTITGNAANNFLYDGRGSDILTGGNGNDTFKIKQNAGDIDRIKDFEISNFNEKIDITDFKVNNFSSLNITQQGNNAVINFADNQKLILENVNKSLLTTNNFTGFLEQSVTLNGTSANDNLYGDSRSDYIYAGAGDDNINGGAGDNYLEGGAGADQFFINEHPDKTDTITDFDINNINERIVLRDFKDITSFNNLVLEQQGNDVIISLPESQRVLIKNINISSLSSDNFIFYGQILGSKDRDILTGTRLPDVIYGDDGNDEIYGNENNDYISGGSGNDTLLGDHGDDIIIGGEGDDILLGGIGDDLLKGGAGQDILISDGGNDVLSGGLGSDKFVINKNDNSTITITDFNVSDFVERINLSTFSQITKLSDLNITQNAANAVITLPDNQKIILNNINKNLITRDNFVFYGDDSNLQVINGTAGADTLNGSTLGDTIYGLEGNDAILGGYGNDYISGGLGDDILIGGNGSDIFVITYEKPRVVGSGSPNDNILDINLNDPDEKIDISDVVRNSNGLVRSFNDLQITQSPVGAIVAFPQPFPGYLSQVILLQGVNASDIKASHFIGFESYSNDTPVTYSLTVYGSREDEDIIISLPKAVDTEDGLIAPNIYNTTFSHITDGASVVYNENGTITYTPPANFYGQDSFTYEVTDSDGGKSSATITINIAPANDIPAAQYLSASGTEDNTITIILPEVTDIEDGVIIPDSQNTTFTGIMYGASVFFNSDGSITYTPRANFYGNDSFIYNVADSNGNRSSGKVSINLAAENDLPVAKHINISILEDQPAIISLSINDIEDSLIVPNANNTTFSNIKAGATVAFTDNGKISYTPPVNFYGEDSFTYEITDSNGGKSSATITINVAPVNDTPVAQALSVSGAEDNAITITLPKVTDAEDGIIIPDSQNTTFTGVMYGASVIFNSDGSIAYTPRANFYGNDSFIYSVVDSNGNKSSGKVSINLAAENDLPIAAPINISIQEDQPAIIILPLINDVEDFLLVPNANNTTFSNITEGATVTFTSNRVISYTPPANFYGEDSFTYEVTDADGGKSSATITVNVAPANDIPVTKNLSVSGAEDNAITIILPEITDIEDGIITLTTDNITFSNIGYGASVSLNNDGTISYKPSPNFYGQDSFTYKVTDSAGGVSSGIISVNVLPVNDLPSVKPINISILEDQSATIILPFASDVEDFLLVPNANNTTFSNITEGATVTFTSNGVIKYTPPTNFYGEDSFTYEVTDADGGKSSATITVNVAPVNDRPVTKEVSASGTEDNTITIILPEVTDIEDGIIIPNANNTGFSGINLGAQIIWNDDGTISYKPSPNFYGQDSFTYKVTDSVGGVSSGIISVNVQSVNDLPVVAAVNITTKEDKPVNIILPVASDVEDSLIVANANNTTFSNITAGAAVTFASNGVIKYTPPANFYGQDSFTYEITDSNGGKSSATITVNISSVNDLPSIQNTLISTFTNEDELVTISFPQITDIEDGIIIPNVNNATFGGINPGAQIIWNNDGTISYKPSANFYGEDSFTYKVTDSTGGVTSGTVSVNILPVNDLPSVKPINISIREDQPATIILPVASDIEDSLILLSANNTTFINITPGAAVTFTSNGVISYTPPANFYGEDSFTYEVTDANGGKSSATITVNVAPVNDIPVTQALSVSGAEDNAIAIILPEIFDIEDGIITTSHDNITFSNVRFGALVSINDDGTINYKPSPNFYGQDSFTYKVTDSSGGVSSRTITVNVESVNDLPNVTAVNIATKEDQAVTIILPFVNDVEDFLIVPNANNTTFSNITAGAAVTFTSNRVISYTPPANFSGEDSFTYEVTDANGGKSSATITVNVAPVNDIPVTQALSVSGAEDNAIAIVLPEITGAEDGIIIPDSQNTTFTGIMYGASVVFNNDGGITYTPPANFSGNDSFIYSVVDSNGNISSGKISINLAAENDLPIVTAVNITTQEDQPVTIILPIVSDVEDSLIVANTNNTTFSNITSGASVTFTSNGVISYTPPANLYGQDSFTYEITDSNGGKSSATITVNISFVNDLPFIQNPEISISTNEDELTVISLSQITDIEDGTMTPSRDNITFSNVRYGALVSVNDDGTINYKPSPNFYGQDSFTYKFIDSVGGVSSGTVSVDVLPANNLPVANPIEVQASIISATQFMLPWTIDVEDGTIIPGYDNTTFSNITEGATVAFINDYTVSYTAPTGFSGKDSFIYNIKDSSGGVSSGIVTINIPSAIATFGTGNADAINGSIYDDVIYANSGNDTVNGGDGDDILSGGRSPNVTVFGNDNDGDDTINGDRGDDVITFSSGNDILTGGLGSDTFVFKMPSWWQASYTHTITDFNLLESDKLDLASLNDLFNSVNQIRIDASGNDSILYTSVNSNIAIHVNNTSPEDLRANIIGITEGPIVTGYVPGFQVRANQNITYTIPDNIFTDLDDQVLTYSVKYLPSWLVFDPITHTFSGTAPILGYDADWNIELKASDATKSASLYFNIHYDKKVFVTGTNGDDYLSTGGNTANYHFEGNDGNDHITGGSGNDILIGGNGDDILNGKSGNDVIDGGAGKDIIYVNTGQGTLTGGDDSDTFIVGNISGSNTITDFDVNDTNEKIIFNNVATVRKFSDLILTQDGDNTVLDYGIGNIILNNITADQLSADNFKFNTNVYGSGANDYIVNAGNPENIITPTNILILDATGGGWPSFSYKVNFIFMGETGESVYKFTDFNPGSSVIQITGIPVASLTELMVLQEGANTRINLSEKDYIILENTDHSTITENNFQFSQLSDWHNNTIDAGEGDDYVEGGAGDDNILGGVGNDELYGDEGNDTISGDAGDDTIYGGIGNDTLSGGAGSDVIDAGEGDDNIIDYSSSDNNIAFGGYGNDVISLGGNNNLLVGEEGDDYLISQGNNSILIGGSGNDKIRSDVGSVQIHGDDGDDTILISSGNSTVHGGAGRDTITLGSNPYFMLPENVEAPILTGSIVHGDDDNDRIYITNESNNILYGDAGDDIFYFSTPYQQNSQITNIIADFEINNLHERIDLQFVEGVNSFSDLTITQDGDNATINMSGNQTVILNNIQASSLKADNFIFKVIGNNDDKWLVGAETANNIQGGSGNETFFAFGDDNYFAGGGGNNIFVANSGLTYLTIKDFNPAKDIINLGHFINVHDFSNLYIEDYGSGFAYIYPNGAPDWSAGGLNAPMIYVEHTGAKLTAANFSFEALNVPPILSHTIKPLDISAGALFSFTIPDDTFTDVNNDNIVYSAETINGDPLPTWLSFDPVNKTFSGTAAFQDAHDIVIKITASDGSLTSYTSFNLSVGRVEPTQGNDSIEATALNDIVYALEGDDIIHGNAGNDTLYGGEGNDSIFADSGNNKLYGEEGEDILYSGTSDDILSGGNGKDIFVITPSAGNNIIITDFNADNEIIDLTALTNIPVFAALNITVNGNDTRINLTNNQVITLKNTTPGQIRAENFLGLKPNTTPEKVGIIYDINIQEDVIRTVLSKEIISYIFKDADTGDHLTYSLSNASGGVLPSWLSISYYTGEIISTLPTNDDVGSYNLIITATDAAGAFATQNFVLNIENTNDAPVVLNNISDYEVTAGQEFYIKLADDLFNDVDGDTLIYSLNQANNSTIPAWLTFNSTTMALSGTAPAGFNGNLHLEIIASDSSGGIVTQKFDIITQIPVKNGTNGDDALNGTAGSDTINGSGGNDRLTGGLGADTLDGGEGWDIASYTDSIEAVTVNMATNINRGGTAEGDILFNIERVFGSNYNDSLTGGTGNDYLYGNNGNDLLIGNAGNDSLFGENGDDILSGGTGNDTLTGGAGIDKFIISTSANNTTTITDFNITNEIIDLSSVTGIVPFAMLNIVAFGSNTQINLAGNQKIILTNVVPSALTAAHFVGLPEFNIVTGTSSDEGLRGTASNDKIYGFAGNDGLTGGLGADMLDGGAGWDVANYADSLEAVNINLATNINKGGTAEGDTIFNIERVFGSGYNDTMTGGLGQDFLYGNNGNDVLYGAEGNDSLFGENGDDILSGGTGNDTLSGNAGIDKFIISTSANSTTTITDFNITNEIIDLSAVTGIIPFAMLNIVASGSNTQINLANNQKIILTNVAPSALTQSHFVGLPEFNIVTGTSSDEGLRGTAGFDKIFGLDGNDGLTGGLGADMLDGGAGWDVANYADSLEAVNVNLATNINKGGTAEGDTIFNIERVFGSNHNDTLTGAIGNDYLYGNNGNDLLIGGAGNDGLFGENGDDTLSGGTGNDILTGGAGIDKFIISTSANSRTIIADFNVANEIIDLSGVAGSSPFAALNILASGNDTQVALASGQKIILTNVLPVALTAANFTGLGDYHTFTGTSSDEGLYGTSGADKIYGLAGNDGLNGGFGADMLDGGDGWDVASYTDSNEAVTVNLATNVNHGGTAEGDTIFNIERVFGSNHNDTLTGSIGNDSLYGNNGNDTLIGGAGNDSLFGENGNDIIIGGLGKDTIWGNAGFDNFKYENLTDSTQGSYDTIQDFTQGQDKIDLAGLFTFGIDHFTDLNIMQNSATNETIISANDSAHPGNVDYFELHLKGLLSLNDADFNFG